jgi:hypothetical protein
MQQPHMIDRRIFFKTAMAGVAGYFASPLELPAQGFFGAPPQPQPLGTAKNVIFILMAGAPSQVDTFDLKVGPWTPADFTPTTINGFDFPEGLLPGLARQLQHISVVRSMQSTALVHPLLQTWTQIARNPTSATGKIAPNIGSIVALEAETERRSDQPLPGFVSLNTGGRVHKQGYLPGRYSPFDTVAEQEGLSNLNNAAGEDLFTSRFEMLQLLDARNRLQSQYGTSLDEMHDFYVSGRRLMYEPRVSEAFQFSDAEAERFGSSGFGNSCIVARNILKGDLGTRYIQINSGGWDHHQDIYLAGVGLYARAAEFDPALSTLIDDLASTPGSAGKSLLDDTLIVAKGEFGRTVGTLTSRAGRDHYFVHSALFAGGGIVGGRIVGQTTPDGRFVETPGWSANRPATAEDVAATIYSATGINYKTIRTDDPLGRGFPYIPSTPWQGTPISELFQ